MHRDKREGGITFQKNATGTEVQENLLNVNLKIPRCTASLCERRGKIRANTTNCSFLELRQVPRWKERREVEIKRSELKGGKEKRKKNVISQHVGLYESAFLAFAIALVEFLFVLFSSWKEGKDFRDRCDVRVQDRGARTNKTRYSSLFHSCIAM